MVGHLLFGVIGLLARGEDLPRGQIIDNVKCVADATESYSLYLPSTYSTDRQWGLVIGFDPRARGKTAVERYQAAAEAYGYVVAGSNNSRNGSWDSSAKAIQAMSGDLFNRFAIDDKRVYTAGMSGGARVAMQVALSSGKITGVIASSAGFPDGKLHKTVPFAIFGTAGTEDFNYREMRELDRTVTSPHHLAIFEGGHVWLSSELAMEAIEWMEIQGMKSGRLPRDPATIDKVFATRQAKAAGMASPKDEYLESESLAADFTGLKDVTQISARAAELKRQKAVKDALKKDRSEDQREEQTMTELLALENLLNDTEKRDETLAQLRERLSGLDRKAKAAQDSPERRMARRVMGGIVSGATERVKDPEYRMLMNQFRPARRNG